MVTCAPETNVLLLFISDHTNVHDMHNCSVVALSHFSVSPSLRLHICSISGCKAFQSLTLGKLPLPPGQYMYSYMHQVWNLKAHMVWLLSSQVVTGMWGGGVLRPWPATYHPSYSFKTCCCVWQLNLCPPTNNTIQKVQPNFKLQKISQDPCSYSVLSLLRKSS